MASTTDAADSGGGTTGSLTVLIGGARSGKSALAVRWGRAFAGPVTYIATGWAGDDEMHHRIARHRAERPSHWTTVEERDDLANALATAAPDALVIVDCLTMWIANVFADLDDADVLASADAIGVAAADRDAPTVIVSNEVGQGIVPADAPTRRYRDLLGAVNATVTAHADHAWHLIAGRVVALQPPPPQPWSVI